MLCGMVILNYRDKLRARSLAQACAKFQIIEKIVIVDNCSNDGSFEDLCSISSEKIEVIQSGENGGFAKGNNCGARHLISRYNPKYILFANTDTLFPEDNIKTCVDALEENPQMGLISCRMKTPDGLEQESYFSVPTYTECLKDFFYLYRRMNYINHKFVDEFEDRIIDVGAVRGSFMFFKTKALAAASYFDENTFLYCEESIMSMRLAAANYSVGLCTDIWYVHDHIESKSNTKVNEYRRLYESRIYMMTAYKKIGSAKKLLMIVLARYSLFELKVIERIKWWRHSK